MFYYAQINTDNICIAQSQSTAAVDNPALVKLSTEMNVLGKRWNATTQEWQDVELSQPAPKITLLEFRNLFTLAERLTLDNTDLLDNSQIIVKSMINTLMSDLRASTFIDPLNDDILTGLAFLQACSLLETQTRSVEILMQLRHITESEAQALLDSATAAIAHLVK